MTVRTGLGFIIMGFIGFFVKLVLCASDHVSVPRAPSSADCPLCLPAAFPSTTLSLEALNAARLAHQ